MTRKDLIDRVRERLGVVNPADPAQIVRVVATNIGAALSREGSRALAEALPTDLAPPTGPPHDLELEGQDLFVRTAAQLDVDLSHAAEYVTTASEVIAEALGPVVAERLRRDLAPSVARLLQPAEPLPGPPLHLHHSARTLAEAEPSRALYSAHPSTIQSGSVAAEANPHSDTKLSTAVGLTQERTGRTIASASPHKK